MQKKIRGTVKQKLFRPFLAPTLRSITLKIQRGPFKTLLAFHFLNRPLVFDNIEKIFILFFKIYY